MANGLTGPRVKPRRDAGFIGRQQALETPTLVDSKGSIFGDIAKLASQLFLGREFGQQLGRFEDSQFTPFNLPNQVFGEGEARRIATGLEQRLISGGVGDLERSGLADPSRAFANRRQAGVAGSNQLAALLSSIDAQNLQRSGTAQTFSNLRQERKGGIASTVGDIAGLALDVIPGGGVVKSIGKFIGGLF